MQISFPPLFLSSLPPPPFLPSPCRNFPFLHRHFLILLLLRQFFRLSTSFSLPPFERPPPKKTIFLLPSKELSLLPPRREEGSWGAGGRTTIPELHMRKSYDPSLRRAEEEGEGKREFPPPKAFLRSPHSCLGNWKSVMDRTDLLFCSSANVSGVVEAVKGENPLRELAKGDAFFRPYNYAFTTCRKNPTKHVRPRDSFLRV